MTSRRAARRLTSLAGLVLLLAAGGAAGLATDKDQPMDLEADAADIDEGRGVSVYTGNVVATQGSMRLESEKLTVHHPAGKAQRIEAEGRGVFLPYEQFQELWNAARGKTEPEPAGPPRDARVSGKFRVATRGWRWMVASYR